MNFQIKNFTVDDYEDVFALWKRTPGICLSASDSKENISEYIEKNKNLCFVARTSGQLLGAVLCGFSDYTGFIHHLAVEQGVRRKGVGRKLVEKCLRGLKKIGLEKCQIVVAPDNSGGQRFWEALGWKRIVGSILETDLALVSNPDSKTFWEQETSTVEKKSKR